MPNFSFKKIKSSEQSMWGKRWKKILSTDFVFCLPIYKFEEMQNGLNGYDHWKGCDPLPSDATVLSPLEFKLKKKLYRSKQPTKPAYHQLPFIHLKSPFTHALQHGHGRARARWCVALSTRLANLSCLSFSQHNYNSVHILVYKHK